MTPIPSHQGIKQIYRLKEITQLTGLSRSTIYDKLNHNSPRYDSTFPRSVPLGPRAVGWLSSEILLWIESRKTSSQVEKGEK
jgi:prophage regulatory protein